MNCKPGDLAVVVRSEAGNEGKIVRVIRFIGFGERFADDCWHVEPALRGTHRMHNDVSDSRLRPIRDNDGEDEMLRIVGKPQEVTA